MSEKAQDPLRETPRIIGIMLVRNEELFLPWALTNVLDFCDEIIIADNFSTDATSRLCEHFRALHSKIEYFRIEDAMSSHALISHYAGQNVWIFGVDGDEIYDPAGLQTLRTALKRGHYDSFWRLKGHSLHAVSLDFDGETAAGYASPTSKSVTKLYNFGALQSWDSSRQERLHGGPVVFKPGWSYDNTLDLHDNISWTDTPLRCLHLCFQARSRGEESGAAGRLNPLQVRRLGRLSGRIAALFGFRTKRTAAARYKQDRYRLGDTRQVSIAGFGNPRTAHPDRELGALAENAAVQK